MTKYDHLNHNIFPQIAIDDWIMFVMSSTAEIFELDD